MASETLVESRIRDGERLVQALEARGLRIKTALWLFYPDLERWKLVIAPFEQVRDFHAVYLDVVRSIRELGLDPDLAHSASVNIVQPDDAIVRGLPDVGSDGSSPVRLRQNGLYGAYLEDAFLYRNAA